MRDGAVKRKEVHCDLLRAKLLEAVRKKMRKVRKIPCSVFSPNGRSGVAWAAGGLPKRALKSRAWDCCK